MAAYKLSPIFIRKKTEILINSVFFCLVFIVVTIVVHFFNQINIYFILLDLVFLFSALLSLFLVRRQKFEEAANTMIVGTSSTIFIQTVARDYFMGVNVTYFRFLETEILLISGLLVVCLFAYKNYQIYLLIFIGLFTIIAHYFMIIHQFYDGIHTTGSIADLIIYAAVFLLSGFFANNIYLVYNRFLYISDKQTKRIRAFNKDLKNKVRARTELLEEQNETLKKVNDELDRFVYSVSHDLRSPLTSVLGLVYIARLELEKEGEVNTGQLIHYLDLLTQSINKLDNLIKDIIDLSRNARVEVTSDAIDFAELINDIIVESQFIPQNDQIIKEINIADNRPFYTDRIRLKIILSNLISNAIKYSNKSEAWIKIKVEFESEELNTPLTAVIIIEDNGEGISKEHIDKIFNMFYRATIHKHGSGLGLYIVKETVLKLGGEINVHSKINQGTTFRLTIPSQSEFLPK